MDDLDLGATIRGFTPGQKVFGRYALVRILGRGGMGVVWLARDESLEREVAIKMLPEIVAADPGAVRDLKRETARSQRLSHPRILRTYDFVEAGHLCGITMEVVTGGTLTARRLDQPEEAFTAAALTKWVRQLCEALDYAHREVGIVHRDLKPANLMLDASDDLKVADFGIARSISDSVSRVSAQAGSSGTPVYMSPQQMMGEDPAVTDDVYALGATLYELLTGKPPFHSGNVIVQVQSKVPALVNERRRSIEIEGEPAPPEWEETIAACLAKEAGDRPQSAGEVAERLGLGELTTKYAKSAKNTEAAAPAAAKEVGRTGPGAPPSRSRAPLYAGLVAVVAALAFGGWWFGVHAPEQRRIEAERIAEARRVMEEERTAVRTRERAEREDRERDLILARIAGFVDGSPEALRAETDILVDAYLRTAPERHGPDVRARWNARQTAWESAARAEAERREAERLAAARGGIVVRTDPPGAEVAVGGVGIEASPATIRELRLGEYEVTISKSGFESQTLRLEVEENRFTQPETIGLVPSTGSVEITSNPSGMDFELSSARLVAEGRAPVRRAGKTPTTEADLPIGAYTVVQRREGWPEQTRTVAVGRNSTASAAAEFIPGSLRVESVPSGAEVLMGARVLGVTPLVIPEVVPGEHTFELHLKDHESQTVAGTLGAGEELRMTATLVEKSFYTEGERATIPGLNMEMLPIAPGTFSMGTASGGYDSERPVTQVTISKPFWLGRTEVTQAQWQAIMGSNPSHFKGENLPVEGVSWYDAMEYCRKLTERERAARRLPEGYVYTLPTEAQWEYACRAGTTGDYAGNLDAMAWYTDNRVGRGKTQPVGSKQANAWGLYDMHGNVDEWCLDWHGSYPGGNVTDPVGPASGRGRVTRGGDWWSHVIYLRSSSRGGLPPDLLVRGFDGRIGFRLALSSVR